MENEGNKVNFDLSLLSLNELIELYDEIDSFLQNLNNMKVEEEGDSK